MVIWGQIPEIRYTADGIPMATFSLATTDAWKDKEGKRQEKTEWHRIVFYKGLAEVAGEYLKKGVMVYLEGKLRTREWEDKEGTKRYTTEISGNLLKMLNKNPGKHPYERICPGRRRTGRSFLAEIKFINTCPPQGGLHQKVKMKVVAIKRDPKCVILLVLSGRAGGLYPLP